ncbi:Uncharacterised protein [Edwardsiella tarda]|nr:Uncharacterised protein [Edwardsiella tarda]
MRDASGQSSFIVKNSNNVTRIVRSEQTYNGLLTVLELDGEQVTFYSGAGNNPVSSAPASSSGMGSLVTLATP